MEENIIIKSKLKNIKPLCIFISLIGLLIYLVCGFISSNKANYYGEKQGYEYGFGMGNGTNAALIPMIFVLAIVGIIIYTRWSKIQITVTDKRVFGYNSFAKRVDLPLDSITAIGTSAFSGLAVTTASGAIKFIMLKNRDEIHDTISKLLVDRQDKAKAETVIKQEISHSNADELKKYKELLDMGAITQEEFDAKKKEILGL